MIFRARKFKFVFPRPALVMGIVNVTPDSFSDGGRYFNPKAAVEHGMELVAQGADIIDIGGESTRPGAMPVSEAEELRRVLPVITALARKVRVPISIDTLKPAVARAALAAGASIVNDVGANRTDNAMWRLVAGTGAGYVLMHMQGTPQTMQKQPRYRDVVREVRQFFRAQLRKVEACGVTREQVMLDVGIGFGKTLEHNLLLLAGLRSFTSLERPLLLGVSRKSFAGKLRAAAAAERLPAILAATVLAAATGANGFRTHDVTATVQSLRMAEAILARKK